MMPSGRLLRQLIKTGSEGNVEAFRKLSEQVIQEEREKQHHLLATDLERILYAGPRSVGHLRLPSAPLPRDRDSGIPLITILQPSRGTDAIVLANNARERLDQLLMEHRRGDVLLSYGLRPANKILLWGPPGTGKTLLAEVIATELDLTLAVVRLDSLVSSLLGETATNVRKVFEFIEQAPVVALFDEFDAIGKERALEDDHGELKRVVSAVLQMFDAYRGESIIVAATNHENILDSAVWRRFDEILQLAPPGPHELDDFLQLKLQGVRREFTIGDPRVIDLFTGRSFADVERILRRAIKRMVLESREFLTLPDMAHAQSQEGNR